MPQQPIPKPSMMTWARALPVLVVCLLFDAIRFFFEQFWFFGPALSGVYCTSKVSDYVGMLWGLTPAACGAAAAGLGYVGSPYFTAFGIVVAMAVGLFGWLTIGLLLLLFNPRIFKENAGHTPLFILSLLISEAPLIGSIPGLTGITVKMYAAQIKKDKEMMKKYQTEQEISKRREAEEQRAVLVQARSNEYVSADIY